MEIPISDVSDNRGDKIGLLDILLRLADTFSELRDGTHTSVAQISPSGRSALQA